MKATESETRSYPPSFLDRFMSFIERLPWSYWLTYLGLFILENLLVFGVAWIAGWLPPFKLLPLLFSYPLWLWAPLALMTHLNRVAREALADFCPLLEVDDQQMERLKVEFTVMPARNVILSGVIWSVICLLATLQGFRTDYQAIGLGPSFSAVVMVEGLISFATGSAIFYHSYRQLRLVNQAVKMVGKFDLFRLNPVYSFLRVTSQIGVAWILLFSLTLLLFPIRLASLPLLALLALQLLLAMAAFVLPLLFVNRRLVSEKRRLLAE